ncbi:MAG: hypothetical protein QG674_76 [Patescibacteria group bacterium]|nr:hypothetical protein [Patescibacteria group bacterium]
MNSNAQKADNKSSLVVIKTLSPEQKPNPIVKAINMALKTFLSKYCTIMSAIHYQIYQTHQYNAITRLQENRDLNEAHVHALMQSFQKDGYLFTILYLNENLEMIDGQHRFEAAKRLHLPVFFIICPGWSIKEVAILNVNSKNWTMEDFMNTHAKSGNMNYVTFKDFFDNHQFDITTCQMILFGRRTGGAASSTNDEFRSGKMILTDTDAKVGRRKAEMIEELKDFHPLAWKSRNFVEAILKIVRLKGYDHKHMIRQLKNYPDFQLREARSLRVEEYLHLLESKYNHRKKDKVKFTDMD